MNFSSRPHSRGSQLTRNCVRPNTARGPQRACLWRRETSHQLVWSSPTQTASPAPPVFAMSHHHHHSSGARSTTAAYQLNVTLRFTNDLPNGPYANINGPARTAEVFINQDTSRTLADVKQTIESTAAKVLRDVSLYSLTLRSSSPSKRRLSTERSTAVSTCTRLTTRAVTCRSPRRSPTSTTAISSSPHARSTSRSARPIARFCDIDHVEIRANKGLVYGGLTVCRSNKIEGVGGLRMSARGRGDLGGL